MLCCNVGFFQSALSILGLALVLNLPLNSPLVFFHSLDSFFPSQIIQRRKRSEMQTEYDFVWPNPQTLIQSGELPSPSPSQAQASLEEPQDPLKTSYSLWVSVCLQAKIQIWRLKENDRLGHNTKIFCLGAQTAESQDEGFILTVICLNAGVLCLHGAHGLNYGGAKRRFTFRDHEALSVSLSDSCRGCPISRPQETGMKRNRAKTFRL